MVVNNLEEELWEFQIKLVQGQDQDMEVKGEDKKLEALLTLQELILSLWDHHSQELGLNH